MHAVNPIGVEGLDSVHDVPDRLIVGEYPDLAVVLTHHAAEILSHHWRLVARLYEQIRGKHALSRLVEQHHRVPVMHVWRLQPAQLVLTEIDQLALAVALDAP